jgi:hypothetical protein
MRSHVLTGFLALAGFSLAMTATSNAGELLHPHRRAGCSSCNTAPRHSPGLCDHLLGCWPCALPGFCGMDDWGNCNCNGSYKFPVPPQYTYHWPGMYSQQLMTDYQSPWRYPPLKPYFDEPSPGEAQPYPAMIEGEALEEEAVEEAVEPPAPRRRPSGQPAARSGRVPRVRMVDDGIAPVGYRR